jgi:hypothetical protein
MKKSIVLNTNLIGIALVLICALYSAYSFLSFCMNARLVYSYKKDMVIKNVLIGSEDSWLQRDLIFKNIYDVQKETVIYNDVDICAFQWSKITSIHRLLFFNGKSIQEALDSEKVYFYLYSNESCGYCRSEIFGLSLNVPPSKTYLYTDYFRSSVKLNIIFTVIIWQLLLWSIAKFNKAPPPRDVIFLPLIAYIVLFFGVLL